MSSHLSIQTHKPNGVAIKIFICTNFCYQFFICTIFCYSIFHLYYFQLKILIHIRRSNALLNKVRLLSRNSGSLGSLLLWQLWQLYQREKSKCADPLLSLQLSPLQLLCSHSRRTTSQNWLSCPAIFGNWVTSLHPTCVISEIPVKLFSTKQKNIARIANAVQVTIWL